MLTSPSLTLTSCLPDTDPRDDIGTLGQPRVVSPQGPSLNPSCRAPFATGGRTSTGSSWGQVVVTLPTSPACCHPTVARVPSLQTAGPFMSQPSLPSSCSSPWCLEQNPNPSLCPPPVEGGPVPPPTPHHSTAAPDTQVTPAGPVLRSLPAPALKEAPSCLSFTHLSLSQTTCGSVHLFLSVLLRVSSVRAEAPVCPERADHTHQIFVKQRGIPAEAKAGPSPVLAQSIVQFPASYSDTQRALGLGGGRTEGAVSCVEAQVSASGRSLCHFSK